MLNSVERLALKLVSVTILIACTVFSLYIYAFGKATPGGGFQAGAILASGILIYRIFDNQHDILSHNAMITFIAIGAMIFLCTGFISLLFGGQLFEYSSFHADYGHVIGSFIVETGVFVVVTASLVGIGQALWNY